MNSRTYNKQLTDNQNGRDWTDDWKDTEGGFNPAIFQGLDQNTTDRLRAVGLGPEGVGYDSSEYSDSDHAGFWRDGPSYERDVEDDEILWQHEEARTLPKNRGHWQTAAATSGLWNVENKDQLNQLLDRTEALKAEHGDFLADGWQQKDYELFKQKEKEQAPVTDQPSSNTDQPETQAPQPSAAVDSPSSNVQQAAERALEFNPAATTVTSESANAATNLNEKFKFQIKDNLVPSNSNSENAIQIALG